MKTLPAAVWLPLSLMAPAADLALALSSSTRPTNQFGSSYLGQLSRPPPERTVIDVTPEQQTPGPRGGVEKTPITPYSPFAVPTDSVESQLGYSRSGGPRPSDNIKKPILPYNRNHPIQGGHSSKPYDQNQAPPQQQPAERPYQGDAYRSEDARYYGGSNANDGRRNDESGRRYQENVPPPQQQHDGRYRTNEGSYNRQNGQQHHQHQHHQQQPQRSYSQGSNYPPQNGRPPQQPQNFQQQPTQPPPRSPPPPPPPPQGAEYWTRKYGNRINNRNNNGLFETNRSYASYGQNDGYNRAFNNNRNNGPPPQSNNYYTPYYNGGGDINLNGKQYELYRPSRGSGNPNRGGGGGYYNAGGYNTPGNFRDYQTPMHRQYRSPAAAGAPFNEYNNPFNSLYYRDNYNRYNGYNSIDYSGAKYFYDKSTGRQYQNYEYNNQINQNMINRPTTMSSGTTTTPRSRLRSTASANYNYNNYNGYNYGYSGQPKYFVNKSTNQQFQNPHYYYKTHRNSDYEFYSEPDKFTRRQGSINGVMGSY